MHPGFLSGSSPSCAPVFVTLLHARIARAEHTLLCRAHGSGSPLGRVCGAEHRGDGNKGEMQWVYFFVLLSPPLAYLGYSPSACRSEQWEAFVVQIKRPLPFPLILLSFLPKAIAFLPRPHV